MNFSSICLRLKFLRIKNNLRIDSILLNQNKKKGILAGREFISPDDWYTEKNLMHAACEHLQQNETFAAFHLSSEFE